jgi:hypothetical protein
MDRQQRRNWISGYIEASEGLLYFYQPNFYDYAACYHESTLEIANNINITFVLKGSGSSAIGRVIFYNRTYYLPCHFYEPNIVYLLDANNGWKSYAMPLTVTEMRKYELKLRGSVYAFYQDGATIAEAVEADPQAQADTMIYLRANENQALIIDYFRIDEVG